MKFWESGELKSLPAALQGEEARLSVRPLFHRSQDDGCWGPLSVALETLDGLMLEAADHWDSLPKDCMFDEAPPSLAFRSTASLSYEDPDSLSSAYIRLPLSEEVSYGEYLVLLLFANGHKGLAERFRDFQKYLKCE